MGEKIIVDTDVLVALFRKDDLQHKKAVQLVEDIQRFSYEFITLNIVIQEAATVLSNRVGMDLARLFYERIGEFLDQCIPLDEKIEEKAWDIFLKQTKKRSSFIDCAVLAGKEILQCKKILAFDTFYPKETRILN